MMKLLITGFEPFGEHHINPSQMLIEALPDAHLGITLVKAILPVNAAQAPVRLIELLEANQPEAVIAFGLAAGRAKISLERVALNLLDFSIADNAGETIKNTPVSEGGPAAYFSTLPLDRMLTALTSAGIPAETSLSAGAYLCNQVFYTLMHTLAQLNPALPAGFVHLPALPEQAAKSERSIPSMGLKRILAAAHLMIEILGQPATS